MKYRKKWLDIPGLSQYNPNAAAEGQVANGSVFWCGRTSVTMIYNYYLKVAGKADSDLAFNNSANASKPYNLILPSGTQVVQGYGLSSALMSAKTGWEEKYLYPVASRPAAVSLSQEQIDTILEPVTRSIDNNNPVLFYSGISHNQSKARHLIVICGYDRRNSDVWLRIKDPATMNDGGTGKVPLLHADNLDIFSAGVWGSSAAEYWIRTKRLFEVNQWSTNATDLWCDHCDSPGFRVFVNANPTPDSAFSHVVTGFNYPLSERSAVHAENAAWYFWWNEKKNRGGYFPLGANSVWHGGVHLQTRVGSTVVACSEGKILAARLADDPAKAFGHYGSRNFILCMHQTTGEFLNKIEGAKKLTGYTLSGGGAFLRSSPKKEEGNSVGLLKKGAKVAIVTPALVSNGGFQWLKVKVESDPDNALAGQEGYIAYRAEILTPESTVERIFDPQETVTYFSLYMHLNTEPLAATNEKIKALPWVQTELLKARKNGVRIRSAPNGSTIVIQDVKEGAKLRILATATVQAANHVWAHVKVVEAKDAANVGKEGWVATELCEKIRVPDEDLLKRLKAGNVLHLDVPVNCGDPLWTSGECGSFGFRTGLLHWELFSEKNLFPKWKQADDPDGDFNVDCKAITGMVEQDFFGSNDLLSLDEVVRFYSQNTKASALRRWVCRFMSEWGVDLGVAIPKMKGKGWWPGNLEERLRPYCWWQEARSAGVPLPQTPKVWHYNPIAVIQQFSGLLGPGGQCDAPAGGPQEPPCPYTVPEE